MQVTATTGSSGPESPAVTLSSGTEGPALTDGASRTYDVAAIRAEFPILAGQNGQQPLAYLDSAATSQKPQSVIDAVAQFYCRDNANIHRGLYELGRRATEVYDSARAEVAAFLGIADASELIFTRGTTEALNLLAYAWGLDALRPGDEVLLTVMEHHSNLVPWQMVARRTGATLRFIGIGDDGQLDLSEVDALLSERTRLVSLVHVSNSLGTINPMAEIARRAHAAGALVAVDGAQSVPHLPVDIPELGCDFFAFSGHKMYGPTGIGGLWGRRSLLEAMQPFQGGGDMIDSVQLDHSTYAGLPNRFEAGTPNIAGAAGLAAAVRFLKRLGMAAVREHERHLLAYALAALAEVPGLVIYGPREPAQRSGVISFTLGDVHPHDLATILDDDEIAIRAGHHCTQPLMRRLGLSATARASFGVYSAEGDVDRLVAGLHRARALFAL